MSNPWNDRLPTEVLLKGTRYEIRTDYRDILDICTALTDPELSEQDKAIVALTAFYPEFDAIPYEAYNDALKLCYWFINCGEDQQNDKQAPKLVDWEQDFKYIVAPVNRVVGKEVRAVEYMHWWTFIAAYYEIGDCTFAQIVRIRDQQARGKALDKSDREWYRRNRDLVDLNAKYTAADSEVLDAWTGKKKTAPE